MDKATAEKVVLDAIQTVTGTSIDPSTLTADLRSTPLHDAFMLDSLDAVEVLMDVEDETGSTSTRLMPARFT